MSERADDLYLVDLLDAADSISRSVGGLSYDQFVDHQEKRDAVLWNLMIVGEASTRLSAAVTEQLTEVPWKLIRGFRNRVVHGYFALQWPIVWDLAIKEVPRLREQAEAHLANAYAETYRRWQENKVGDQHRDAQ